MKILIRVLLNTGLGIIFIFIWLQFVDLQQILSTISKVEPLKFIPVLIFLFLSQAIRAFRLKIFLSSIKRISLLDLVFLNGAATMLNFLIPIRGGEVVKGVYLSGNYNIPMGKALIWAFLDRFIDFLTVLILASVLLFIIPTNLNTKFINIIIVIFAFCLLVTYLISYQSNFFKGLVKFLSHLFIVKSIKIYFERILNFLIESFKIFRRKPKELILLFILTGVAYGADAAIWYFTFLAISSPQEYLRMYLAQLLSALTYLIPAAPGYVGSAEASGLLIFSGVFGIEPNLSTAMIVLFHIITAVFIISFGILSVYFLKIDLGVILKRILRKS